MNILFKYTSKSRPSRFIHGLDSIVSNLTDLENYKILCSFDANDAAYMNTEFLEKVSSYKKVIIVVGNSTSKIDAINRDVNDIDYNWDILVNFSDDQEFITKGFDQLIRQGFKDNFVGTDGVLHFKDTNNNNQLMTLSIIGREYYNRTKYIYHPSYISLWCDNEAMAVAKLLEKYAFIDNIIFKHNHPAYGQVPTDAQYQLTESYYTIDGANFEKRNLLNFDLPLEEEPQILLSILIPSLVKRAYVRMMLMNFLYDELKKHGLMGRVEILIEVDEGEITTGQKRNNLVNKAKGRHIVFVDDDDELINGYVPLVVEAVKKNPDVVGFDGYMTTDEEQMVQFRIAKDLPYASFVDPTGKKWYLRHTNHLCPIKKSIALQIPFKDIYHGEDYNYAIDLKNSGLVQTEVLIPKEIYHYKYKSKK